MNYDELKVLIDALQFLWIIGATVWAFWGDRLKAVKARLTTHSEILTGLNERVVRIEESAKAMPTHGDLGDMYGKLGELAQKLERIGGDVRAVKAELGGVRDLIGPLQSTITLVNEFLLSQNKP